jgi:putative ABC transport system substrate-binding protein
MLEFNHCTRPGRLGEIMQRREFITLFGGAAVALPLAAHAQQPRVPVIGFLNGASASTWVAFTNAFRAGLKEAGYSEGENVLIEYRWADGQYERLPSLAAELISRQVDLIATSGGVAAALAAKALTNTIPIVFTAGDADPVKIGLVESLNRPGGNTTGAAIMVTALAAKRLDLLRQMVPKATAFDVLINPNNREAEVQWADMKAAAAALEVGIRRLDAANDGDIERVSTLLDGQPPGGVLVMADPFINSRRERLVAMMASHAIPAVYYNREIVALGGLLGYGASFNEVYRQAGIYSGRILKGAKPADLPVMQPDKFQLILNLRTAKTLGIDVPPAILALADEVIE